MASRSTSAFGTTIVISGFLALAGCAAPSSFECTKNDQCNLGNGGICEADSRCSYPDPACESGRSTGGSAGNGSCLDDGGQPDAGDTDDTTAPSSPQDVQALVASSTRIDLDWTASADDVGVIGYQIERCSGTGCTSFAEVGTASGTAFASSNLTASTSYRFRVRASDAAGNASSYSTIVDATTSAAMSGATVLTFDGAGDQAIPDNNLAGINQTIDVTDTRTVQSLVFRINISHPWRGDIRVTLSHGGTSVILKEHEGPNEDDSANDVVLDLTRTDWNGQSVSGAWTLNVMDFESVDIGRLDSWSIAPTVQ